jgi:hypothetical protein
VARVSSYDFNRSVWSGFIESLAECSHLTLPQNPLSQLPSFFEF